MNRDDVTNKELVPGRFYWAIPVMDCDAEEEWVNEWQPARYMGNDAWQWVGNEIEDWPARGVGNEISRGV